MGAGGGAKPCALRFRATTVRVLRLKKCLLSHLALPGSSREDVAARIFRNDDNHCSGGPMRGNDAVYPNSRYMALLRDTTEPNYREAHATVGTPGGDRHWRSTRTWAAGDTVDGPQ